MIAALKSELRKLWTVRSTYIILGLTLVIIAFYAGYVEGYKANAASLHDSGLLASEVTGAVGAVSVLIALVGLLLFAHEYRYNTITYTLTAANSRSKVLLAKILIVSSFILPLTIIVAIFSPLMTVLGIHLHGLHLVSQTFAYGDLLWRVLFFGWGYSMLALVVAALIRNQVGAIAAFFLVPSMVESLLTLLVKDNAKYLPFTALNNVLNTGNMSGTTSSQAAGIALLYIVGFWVVAWLLFLRRDAT